MTFQSNSPGIPLISLTNLDFGVITDPFLLVRSRFTQLASTKMAIYSTRQQPYPEQLAALSKNPYLPPAVQAGLLDISLTDEEWNTGAVYCAGAG
ncbi:hypothetical protein CPB83DRAFT_303146 [Crepidotus variabilis]|uniref:Uncharacterized protein n=1 Tax=Crepidotus variabilis TaxID=179855 RepID=A0A9P6EGF3_9AGAR|nr:hypothetical protein CPB83DRAFT_303146 [Crepidotus variabilis]